MERTSHLFVLKHSCLTSFSRLERQKTGNRCNPNIAANGFLLLLNETRSIFLQDAMQLRQIHPTFCLLDHPLFSSLAFLSYERLPSRRSPRPKSRPTCARCHSSRKDHLRLRCRHTGRSGAVLAATRPRSSSSRWRRCSPTSSRASGWPRSAIGQLPGDLASSLLAASTSAPVPAAVAAANPLAALQALAHSGPTAPTSAGSGYPHPRHFEVSHDRRGPLGRVHRRHRRAPLSALALRGEGAHLGRAGLQAQALSSPSHHSQENRVARGGARSARGRRRR